mgnify:CR=1 FL=1
MSEAQGAPSVVPTNFRALDASWEAIERDVDYALRIFRSYVERLPGGESFLLGKRVLELGPGHALGTALLLACAGARVTVADRFLVPWSPSYHPLLYRALLTRMRAERRGLDPTPLLELLAADTFSPRVIERFAGGAEELDQLPAERFDLILSNATLEHVQEWRKTLANIYRATAPGGLSVHQVDFRDHRDFSRPLEFMTLDPDSFRVLFNERAGEPGNRARHVDMERELRRLGFEVDCQPNMFAEPAYLADVRPRLHADFQSLPEEVLRVISALYICQRPRQVTSEQGEQALRARLEALEEERRELLAERFVLRSQLAWTELGYPRGPHEPWTFWVRNRLRWHQDQAERGLDRVLPGSGGLVRTAVERLARRDGTK